MRSREAYVKDMIRRRYARQALDSSGAWGGRERARRAGYSDSQLDCIPESIVERWAGCGNVIANAPLDGANLVVDLGAGSGLDALLAKAQSPHVIAIDLTPEMLSPLGAMQTGVQRIAGDIEMLPLADAVCDVIIANAAFNLALDPHEAFAEAWRILRPGGRLHICDLVREGDLPPELLADPLAWSTSLGGVMIERELVGTIEGAGFSNVKITGHRPFAPVISVCIDAVKPDGGTISHDA